jgi:multicomponent Na+:H+ antiporter subunit E
LLGSRRSVEGVDTRETTLTVLEIAILIAVWYILSGRFDLLHFGTGVATAIVIGLTATGVRDGRRFQLLRFLRFAPWLVWQIFISNLRVARLVFSRRMPIRPTFISQPPGVKGDRALTMLAAATTLTPGTLTVDVSRDEVFVHALDEKSARDVREHLMAHEVAPVFPEPAR